MKHTNVHIARLLLVIIFNLFLWGFLHAQPVYRVTPVSPNGDTGRTIVPQTSVHPKVFVPGIFTPNGDGVNDYLQPQLTGVYDFIMTIYDENGQLKAALYQPDHVWEGDNAAAGQYHWRMIWTGNDGNEHSEFGRILLNR